MIYEFLSFYILTVWLFALNGFDFTFVLPIYRSYIEIKQCDKLGFSVQFKRSLQSAFCN